MSPSSRSPFPSTNQCTAVNRLTKIFPPQMFMINVKTACLNAKKSSLVIIIHKLQEIVTLYKNRRKCLNAYIYSHRLGKDAVSIFDAIVKLQCN